MRSAPALIALAILAAVVPRPAGAASHTFRQGLNFYTGTQDVSVSQEINRYWDPNENYDRTGQLAWSGNPVDVAGLIRFDLSSIPSTATVTAVSLSFTVHQNSGVFPLYELKKDFVETEATWTQARAGVPWEQPGAAGPTDRGSTVLATYAPPGGPTPYVYPFNLNLAGVAVVQGWVSTPSNNHGLIAVDTTLSSKATVSSSEDTAPADRPLLTVSYTNASTPFIQSFQDGVSPSTAYSGTRDTSIGNGSIVNIDGSDLRADGYEEDSAALIRFDVTFIPPWSTVTSASLDGWVSDTSTQTYPIYELLRDWTESGATLLNADTTTPWSLRGALSTGTPAPADRSATVLGLWTSRNGSIFNTTALNRFGVKVVQDWVRGVRPNYGFIIQDYADATADGSEWDESGSQRCDTAMPPNCTNTSPGLIVNYVEGRFVFNTPPQRIRVGAPSAIYTVQRQRADDGLPIAVAAAPALGVTVRSNSVGGSFALAPTGPWSTTLSVSIPAGASDSQPFYYRDTAAGNPTLTASLNTSWLNGTQLVSVGSLMLSDDVESGQVPAASGGQWSQTGEVASCSVSAATAAAHRGTFGLRVSDGDGQTGPGTQALAQYSSAPVAPDLYFRTWFRYSGSNQTGDAMLASLGGGPLASMSLVLPAQVLGAAGVNSLGAGSGELGTLAVGEGSWHLLELFANNIGTTAGVRRTYVDGQLNTTATALDWSALGVDSISAGEPGASDRGFTGTLDFDDLRATTSTTASHFVVTAPATVSLDACVPVTLSLRESTVNAQVDGPYDFSASVQLTGVPGALFSDSTCRTPASLVSFPQGVRSAITYASPAAMGTGTVTASFPDLLDGSDSFTIVTGRPLAALPATSTVNPRNVVGLTASGGSGAGYRWSFVVNRSGATLSPGGVYVAGSAPLVTDVVQVVDSLGAVATATIHVVRDLALSPPRAVVYPSGSVTFSVSGGAGAAGAHYSLADNRSGGLVDPLTGVYVAGGTPGVDTVTVTDARGSVASSAVQVLAPSDLRVTISGSLNLGTGGTATYTFQVVDSLGNVALPQALQARLLPVPGVPAALGASMTSTFTAPDAGMSSGTNLTLLTNGNGAASAVVTSRVVERVLVCVAVASDARTEACLLVNVNPGVAHHVRADAAASTSTSCAPARVDVTVVDANDNNLGFASTVQLCASAGSSAVPVSSTLTGAVIAGGCITGTTSAEGTASVFEVDGMDETVTFTPSQTGLINPPVTAQVAWSGRAASPSQTLLELVGATDPAPLSTAPGSSVQVHVGPRDACGQPIAFGVASEVALQLPPPLQATSAAPDSTGFLFTVTSPTCPPLPADPLPIHASLLGAPVTTAGGALAAVNVQVSCRPPRFLSQGATAARCNQPYRYSAAGAPEVDGDGPLVFRATGLPAGATLSPAGELVWIPSEGQVGSYPVDLTVVGAAGSDTQSFTIEVACGSDVPPAPCGCAAAGATPLAVAALALLRAGLRRRRR